MGQNLHYGQVIQLVHYSTNSWVSASKTKRADIDGSAIRLSLSKEPSSNCWFKVMPQFKVRFEGQKIRRGDQIVLVHVKTNLTISLSSGEFSDKKHEVNLSSTETGWEVDHYAPYEGGTENFLKSSEIIRIFHQDREAFLRSDWEPLENDPRFTVFFKERSRKRKVAINKSANALWIVELRDVGRGGIISYRHEVRLKHLGSDRYLSVRRYTDGEPYLALAKHLDDSDTIFLLHPVDKKEDSAEVRYDEYFRIQHRDTESWFHVVRDFETVRQRSEQHHTKTDQKATTGGKEEKNEKKEEKPEPSGELEREKQLIFPIVMSHKIHFEDALVARRVAEKELDDLNYVKSLYSNFKAFAQLV